jgi:hypothetical protein
MRPVRSTRPGYADPSNPASVAKAPASQGAEALTVIGHGRVTPKVAAATMHDNLLDDTKLIGQGFKNVPIHPAQLPTEGADTNETSGDGAVKDPTGIGWGT